MMIHGQNIKPINPYKDFEKKAIMIELEEKKMGSSFGSSIRAHDSPEQIVTPQMPTPS